MDVESHLGITSENLSLYQAIKDNKLEEVKSLLNNGIDVNAPLWTTGPFAGYTALHLACIKSKNDLVELLVYDYEADVNRVGEDGIQPIHLVCFYEECIPHDYTNTRKLWTLFEANANPNAEFEREVFTKHVKDEEWCPEFGDKMTLVTYTIVNKKKSLTECLVRNNANIKIISLTNKTLVMYAIENKEYDAFIHFNLCIDDHTFINHRDNDGIPATHYVFYPKTDRGFWYDINFCHCKTMYEKLFEMGADMNALLNNDPETFLPNIAAYRVNDYVLGLLLRRCGESMLLSKVLLYVTRPLDEIFGKFTKVNPIDDPELYDWYKNDLRERKQNCIEFALKDLIIRRTFGLSVNKNEVQLMDNLIATDLDIKIFVDKYKRTFIDEGLKNKFIEVNNEKITFYEFFKRVFHGKKLKILARDENVNKWYDIIDNNGRSGLDDFSKDYFIVPVDRRIKNAQDRLKLLNKLTKISTLKDAIPLPYELILEIIEFLRNTDLEIFINAFICL